MLVQLHAHTQSGGVVLILGCQPWQKELVSREVARHSSGAGGEGGATRNTSPVDISNEV